MLNLISHGLNRTSHKIMVFVLSHFHVLTLCLSGYGLISLLIFPSLNCRKNFKNINYIFPYFPGFRQITWCPLVSGRCTCGTLSSSSGPAWGRKGWTTDLQSWRERTFIHPVWWWHPLVVQDLRLVVFAGKDQIKRQWKGEYQSNILPEFTQTTSGQECIPVGCVPPAAVAICWGVWPGALPRVWAWRPPRFGPGDPPSQGQTPQLFPWVWAWRPARHAVIPTPPWRPARHAGIPPAIHAGIPPLLWTEWLTDRCKNITFTNFICGR